MSDADQAAFDRILDYLRHTRGFDFTAYKPTSLLRRVRKRMQAIDVSDFDAYLDYLEVHPAEFGDLFNTILINVTCFFRDPDVWESLQTSILPELLKDRTHDDPLRVWSAGCASGEETYSTAMMIAELIGIDAFRERVKVYATDVDEEALNDARRAVYSAKDLEDVPDHLRPKYFDRSGDHYAFNRELRRSVIFGRHDLIQDAPISHVGLLLCRNTLMYFNAEAQARIMARFHFSVKAGGVVVLGRAEMLFSHSAMFSPVDVKRRIFKTTPKVNQRDRLVFPTQSARHDFVPDPNHGRLREMAFDTAGEAQIMLDAMGVLIAANAAARRQFRLSNADIGARLQDLELSYRPAELRTSLDRAHAERREVAVKDVLWDFDGHQFHLDVVVVPLYDDDRSLLGAQITFVDVTPLAALQAELDRSRHELETTNEELQSTNEELETTNEELQSTNEELETMNEELQSSNEELQTMNDELRIRSTELNTTNGFMEAVLTSLKSAVVVVNREMRVQVWNPAAMNLWGLRPEEVQEAYFFGLDIGLPVSALHQPIREVLSGSADQRELTVSATNRTGKGIQCRVRMSPFYGSERAIVGTIVVMEEEASALR